MGLVSYTEDILDRAFEMKSDIESYTNGANNGVLRSRLSIIHSKVMGLINIINGFINGGEYDYQIKL